MRFGIRIVCPLLTAAILVGAGAAFPAQAQVKETVLYSFLGGNDGGFPYAG